MDVPKPLIDLDAARELLKHAVPAWVEILEQLESSGGRLGFSKEVSTIFTNLKIENYPLLYENPEAIGSLLLAGLMGEAEAEVFCAELEQSSPVERGRIMASLLHDLDMFDPVFDLAKSDEEKLQAQAAFALLDPQVQKDVVDIQQRLWMSAFVTFFDYLSVAVHGQRLTSLVAQAKSGDDEAFGKAVQIDGRILTVIPYFKERFARAIMEDQEGFRSMVASKLQRPPYKGRIEHKALWMTFAFLDGIGLLYAVAREQLLDLCNEVGACQSGYPIDDVKNLSKRLSLYREFQGKG